MGKLVIVAALNGDFDNVVKVLSFYATLSSDWDKVEPDIEEFYFT